VQDGEAAEAPDLDRAGGRHGRVHRRGEHRELEPIGVDLPGDVHVVGVARPPRRNDRDLIEAVRPPSRLPRTDLELHATPPPRLPIAASSPPRRKRETPTRGRAGVTVRTCWNVTRAPGGMRRVRPSPLLESRPWSSGSA